MKTLFLKADVRLVLCLSLGLIAPNVFSQTYNQHPDPGPNALARVHPGYDFADLLPQLAADLPAGFSGHIGGMAFLPNGKLAVADFPDPSTGAWAGSVWVLGGVLTGNPNQVTFHRFANNLRGPTGLTVVNGEIYVIDANALRRLTGNDSTGTAVVTNVTGAWNQAGGQPAIADLIYRNGNFHASIGSSGGLTLAGASIAGGMARIATNGTVTRLCTGLRNTGGAGINAQGDMFVTDNQGEWLPSNKLIHVVQGRYYGYGGLTSNGLAASPPAVWIPAGVVSPPSGNSSTYAAGLSPSTVLPIDTGLFGGQLLVGDIRYGNIHRAFLERVQGEYQGALFHFSGGFRAGIYRMAWGPDGALYLGGMGGSGYTWSWKDNRVDDDWGLQRIKPNGRSVFEILAVRAKAGGFEVQFTQPLDPRVAAANFQAQMWSYSPSGSYGGPQVGMTTLTVQSLQLSSDRSTVFLNIPGLVAGRVVHIQLDSNTVISNTGAKPWTFETWYTLNNLSTAVATNPKIPNGFSGKFQVRASQGGGILMQSESGGKFKIRNAQGVTLEEGNLRANEASESMGRYRAGLYFVSLRDLPSIKLICF